MQRVLNYNVAIPLIESYPNDFSDDFQPLLQSVTSNTLTGSVLETASQNYFSFLQNYPLDVLSGDEMDVLKQLYLKLANTQEPIFQKYSTSWQRIQMIE